MSVVLLAVAYAQSFHSRQVYTTTAELMDCYFSSTSSSNRGGAFYAYGPEINLSMVKCIFEECQSNGYGAFYCVVGCGKMKECQLLSCHSSGYYAASALMCKPNGTEVDCCLYSGCTAGTYKICVFSGSPVLSLRTMNITGNQAPTNDGTLYVMGTGMPCIIKYLVLDGNTAKWGEMLSFSSFTEETDVMGIYARGNKFDQGRYFFHFTNCASFTIRDSSFAIGYSRPLLYTTTEAVLSLSNCRFDIEREWLAGFAIDACSFGVVIASVPAAAPGGCEFLVGSTPQFTHAHMPVVHNICFVLPTILGVQC